MDQGLQAVLSLMACVTALTHHETFLKRWECDSHDRAFSPLTLDMDMRLALAKGG